MKEGGREEEGGAHAITLHTCTHSIEMNTGHMVQAGMGQVVRLGMRHVVGVRMRHGNYGNQYRDVQK